MVRSAALLFCVGVVCAQPPIDPARLKGELSFLSSDLLEGRDTPSRGLDIAAEYIASQFRASGLEPAGDDGYFQTAHWKTQEQNLASIEITLGGIALKRDAFRQWSGVIPSLTGARAVKIDWKGAALPDIAGKAVLVHIPAAGPGSRAAFFAELGQLRRKLQSSSAALVLAVIDGMAAIRNSTLMDPESPQVPWLVIRDSQFTRLLDESPAGELADARLSLKVDPPVETPVRIRNVVAVLRGSDPALKDTAVLVSAHYDHLGMRPDGEGDRIYNGANDDGSGTVSLLEIAHTLASSPDRPKRSILFVALFGEEKGSLGARYYVRHPAFPIAKTIADLNMEHLGRTDSNEGPRIGSATLTGFDYSDLPRFFVEAGKHTGVDVYKDEKNSDPFFTRSDNVTFATAGIPAHTICVAYEFPDYHGVGDEWQKIDYDNMAKVDRMITAGVLSLANSPQAPKWNDSIPATKPFVDATR